MKPSITSEHTRTCDARTEDFSSEFLPLNFELMKKKHRTPNI